MLNKQQILDLLAVLNDELQTRGVVGEIGLCGGAVMCLVFNARESTRDVDAIFAPTGIIRDAAKSIAQKKGLPDDWLNDAAKGFFSDVPARNLFREWSNLRVWVPPADFMLAMKCVAERYDTTDADDVRFLVRHLGLTTATQVVDAVAKYYPHERIPAKTQFFIEEIMQTS